MGKDWQARIGVSSEQVRIPVNPTTQSGAWRPPGPAGVRQKPFTRMPQGVVAWKDTAIMCAGSGETGVSGSGI